MNARKTISHEQALELLPWLVNGSMEEHEQHEVREHAQACVICRRELKALELLGGYIRDAAEARYIPASDMRNINARIDDEIERQSWGRGWFSRIHDFFSDPWRLAFAVQTALVIVLAAVLVLPQAPEPEFTTLTQPQAITDGHQIRVVFNPALSVSELARLLDSMALTVTEGPSARGVYTLSVSGELSDAQRAQTFEDLKGNSNVQFAQWVAHPGD